jgi:phage shock protein PspC (stress-responsive transcriptional regulator)
MGITETQRRLLWFVGLWAAGVATVGTVAYIIRLWLMP